MPVPRTTRDPQTREPMTCAAMTWDEVWGRRLRRHFLTEPAPRERLVDVVGAVCGIHAQILPSAELSLGLRVAGLTRSDLRGELWERRSLVKTYGLRGTVHLFPATELRLWLSALRAKPEPRSRPPEQTLTAAEREAVVGAIAEALDGRQLTREELERAVVERLGRWATEPGPPAFGGSWPRWTLGIGAAAGDGVLCFGPNRGNRVTYVRLDQWVPGWDGLPGDRGGDEPLAEVLRRFLVAYGPATPKEFARWFAMDERAAREVFRSLGDEVEAVEVEEWRGWQLAGDSPGPRAGDAVRLLPHFDCYVVGAHPRDRFMHQEWDARGLTAGTASTLPVLLVGGVLGGLWHRVRRGRTLEITVEPFGRLGAAARRRVEAEADRIGAVLECPVSLSFGAVPARPHL